MEMWVDLELVVLTQLILHFLSPPLYLKYPTSKNKNRNTLTDFLNLFIYYTGIVDSCSPSVIGKIFPFKPSNILLVTISIHLFQATMEEFCISSFDNVQKLN